MLKLQDKVENWWKDLNLKKADFQFEQTKFVDNKLEINVKILALLNDKLENVNQLPGFGLIVLNQTILNSHSKINVSEQGIISNDFFKARIIDVDSTIINGVYFHLVKVISGIITVNPDHELLLTADKEFCQTLANNKLAVKLFLSFLQYLLKVPTTLIKQIKIDINNQIFNLKFLTTLQIKKSLIFQARDLVNQFLANKNNDDHNYDFLKTILSSSEKAALAKIELIEIKKFIIEKNKFAISFLAGQEKINKYFLDNKKELLAAIKLINKKIKLLNYEKLSEYHPDPIIDSYEKLAKLNDDYLALKNKFLTFQNQNPDLIKNFINDSLETQYSEKIGDYEFIHINFNNFLIDRDLLLAKSLEKINTNDDKILFLSNNNFDNSMVVLRISDNLINKFNITPLVNQFANSSFKEISYNNQDSVFITADNYQVINDFVSNIINFFKISNNQII